MKINKNNYESFFLDFVEGRLNASLQRELEMFLDANPDLKAELETFKNTPVLIDSEIKFNKKSSLKRLFIPVGDINEFNYENYLVAETEGDLSNEEIKNLKSFISKNPFVETEQKLFQKTILRSDKTIVFTDKNKSKKPVVVQLYWRQIAATMAIAASVLLVLYLNFRNNYIVFTDNVKNSVVPKKQEAEHNLFQKEILNVQISKERNVAIQHQNPQKKSKIIRKQGKKDVQFVEKNFKSDTVIKTENALIAETKADNQVTEIQNSKEEEKKETAEEIANVTNLSVENTLTANKEVITETDEPLTLKEFFVMTFNKKVLNNKYTQKEKKQNQKEKIALLDLASAVINGASKALGKDIKIETQYNENDKSTAVVFTSPKLEISRTMH